MFLEVNGEEKPFNRHTSEALAEEGDMDKVKSVWEKHIAMIEDQMKDVVSHFGLKHGHIEHIGTELGKR